MKKRVAAVCMAAVMSISALTACGGETAPAAGNGDAPAAAGSETSAKLTAKVIDVDLTSEEYAFGVDKDQAELLEKTNEYIAQIMSDGTFDEICNKYFGDGEPTAVVSATEDSSKDQLLVATNAAFAPFEYMEGDSYYGVDMEIAAGLAEYLGKELVIQNMDFDAVCLSVGQHKSDIAMAGLTVKPEREEFVTFSNSYYQASQRLVVRSDNTEFDGVADAAAIEAILNAKDSSVSVGVQNGTTGQLYCEGDEEWEFAGFQMTVKNYKNGSLAVLDLLNGNLDYVVIDAAPAKFITESINAMQ